MAGSSKQCSIYSNNMVAIDKPSKTLSINRYLKNIKQQQPNLVTKGPQWNSFFLIQIFKKYSHLSSSFKKKL